MEGVYVTYAALVFACACSSNTNYTNEIKKKRSKRVCCASVFLNLGWLLCNLFLAFH